MNCKGQTFLTFASSSVVDPEETSGRARNQSKNKKRWAKLKEKKKRQGQMEANAQRRSEGSGDGVHVESVDESQKLKMDTNVLHDDVIEVEHSQDSEVQTDGTDFEAIPPLDPDKADAETKLGISNADNQAKPGDRQPNVLLPTDRTQTNPIGVDSTLSKEWDFEDVDDDSFISIPQSSSPVTSIFSKTRAAPLISLAAVICRANKLQFCGFNPFSFLFELVVMMLIVAVACKGLSIIAHYVRKNVPAPCSFFASGRVNEYLDPFVAIFAYNLSISLLVFRGVMANCLIAEENDISI